MKLGMLKCSTQRGTNEGLVLASAEGGGAQ